MLSPPSGATMVGYLSVAFREGNGSSEVHWGLSRIEMALKALRLDEIPSGVYSRSLTTDARNAPTSETGVRRRSGDEATQRESGE